jgi:predicted RNA-binding protein YlqC (UPF0109 family)
MEQETENQGREFKGSGEYKDMLVSIVSNLVDTPEGIEVDCIERGNVMFAHLMVNKGEVGMVIGRGGHTVDAIKAILIASMMARKDRRKVHVEVSEREVM